MKNLVKQTLEHDFDLPQYTDFIKNLFNEIQIQPQEIKVPDNSQEFIKKITFLSDFPDTQKKTIDIYAVELAGGTKVERARSFQRNLISKLLKDNTKDAGLAAFYSKDNPDWRLSFIKLDYKLTDKGVKVEVGTPPKRYSFLVGKSEPSHTAQKQLLPILEDHKNNPLLLDLEEAFSVERVTKEFYERYRKLFEDLSKGLNKNKAFRIIAEKENIDIYNFAKKLLGQIVFLYFLQKKGWLGVPQDKTCGQGDKFFLRTLFDKAKAGKQDFYDHYLEHLFYDTLNNPRRDEVDPACSRYFDCKIPFLNGGLFEPDYDWENTIIYLENDIFEDIIDTFDLYNFTVKEDELEKEVVVDPEMLGKVFENLLPENLRKGQGAYYTPREIVHYMCQESLINFLVTETRLDIDKIRALVVNKHFEGEGSRELIDRALQNIKACDPACGSGAFLVGMLHEIVSARRILNPKEDEYRLKKEAIQNSIYGVDIDPGAVDIAKLRLWLSLVVDYELKDIEPLPNLDYKIMCGNSLLEELIIGEESIKLFDERLLNASKNSEAKSLLFNDEEFKGKSASARNEYLQNELKAKQKQMLQLHSENKLTPEKKKELNKEIEALNKELNPKSRKQVIDSHPTLFGDKAEKYFNLLKELHKQYFTEYDPKKKREKRKQIEGIENEFIKSSIKEKVDDIEGRIKNLNMQDPGDRKQQAVLLKKKLEYLAIPEQIHNSQVKPYFLWKLNFFEVFQEKGGFDVVIANPPYGFRNVLTKKEKTYFRQIENIEFSSGDSAELFCKKSFDKLLKNNGILTFIIPKKSLYGDAWEGFRKNYWMKYNLRFLLDSSKAFKDVLLEASAFALVKNERQDVVKCSYLTKDDVIVEFGFGRKSEIFLENFTAQIYKLLIPSGLWDKIQNERTKERLVEGRLGLAIGTDFFCEKETDYKLLKGIDIERWKIKSSRWLRNKSKLNWDTAKYFLKPKIVCQRIVAHIENPNPHIKITACYDKDGTIITNTLMSFELSNKIRPEFWLAYLNSNFLSWYVYNFVYAKAIRTMDFYNFYMQQIPIPSSAVEDIVQINFVKIVETIQKIIKSDDYLNNSSKQAKVKEYERQIDQMVYKLYGLTKEEIEIVENSREGKK